MARPDDVTSNHTYVEIPLHETHPLPPAGTADIDTRTIRSFRSSRTLLPQYEAVASTPSPPYRTQNTSFLPRDLPRQPHKTNRGDSPLVYVLIASFVFGAFFDISTSGSETICVPLYGVEWLVANTMTFWATWLSLLHLYFSRKDERPSSLPFIFGMISVIFNIFNGLGLFNYINDQATLCHWVRFKAICFIILVPLSPLLITIVYKFNKKR